MKASFYRYMLTAFTTASLVVTGIDAAFARVDLSKSKITATSKQMNVPVEGTFKKFTAQLRFDPAKLGSAHAELNVVVGSYDLGDESFNEQVLGAQWFDAKTYPQATFVSSTIKPLGGNRYAITGDLTIKGKTHTVTLPVTVSTQGATQIFDGALSIKRSQFDVGTGEWKDTSVVADEVSIQFHIVDVKQ